MFLIILVAIAEFFLIFVIFCLFFYHKPTTKIRKLEKSISSTRRALHLEQENTLYLLHYCSHDLKTKIHLSLIRINEQAQLIDKDIYSRWLYRYNIKQSQKAIQVAYDTIIELEMLIEMKSSTYTCKKRHYLLSKIWNQVRNIHSDNIRGTFQNLSFSGDAVVYCDRELLQYVFTELLSCSLRWHIENQPLTIDIYVQQDENTEITFSASGVGVSSQSINELFTPTNRITANESGLGLAICKEIMLLHQGNITAYPCLNNTLKFIIYLPLINDHENISTTIS